ncbi:MAG: dihydroneopterin aldolase [Armatimonadetes bacterium]|nr:dihydroneopterin aldolase [Armatimonadota bacterium]
MTTVVIQDLEFFGHHGATDEEQELGNRFLAEIKVSSRGTADETDRVEDTVDYAQVAAIVRQVNEESRYRTVERIAGRIGDEILALPHVKFVLVTVKKLSPPMPSVVKYAGAIVYRAQGIER